jgi:predicted ABC-type sugar transport system permease subunit
MMMTACGGSDGFLVAEYSGPTPRRRKSWPPRSSKNGKQCETMSAVETQKRHWSVVILKNRVMGVLLFEALIMIVFSIAARKFLTLSNLNTIFLNACILAILACAEAVVIITRNYDVSVASMLALAAFVGFDLIKRFPDAGPVLIRPLSSAGGPVNG